MFSTTRRSIAQSSAQYGEDVVADWALGCSDEEFVRVCGVADWLIYQGPTTPSGAGMMVDKAVALAAAFVKEGSPRLLRRKIRKNIWADSRRYSDDLLDRIPLLDYQDKKGTYYGVTESFKAFWTKTESD
ncbi:MAG TPA: hypothetical protein VGH57_34350 [Amycolatopsis sp.]|jgi:hypothetical protein